MTRDLEVLKRLYQKRISGQGDKCWIVFSVPLRTAKEKIEVEFHPDAPTLTYQQHDQNSCCFRSLDSSFVVSEELASANEIVMRITAPLSYNSHDHTYRINFSNSIMVYK